MHHRDRIGHGVVSYQKSEICFVSDGRPIVDFWSCTTPGKWGVRRGHGGRTAWHADGETPRLRHCVIAKGSGALPWR